jgi:hypothetical protein
LEEGQASVRRGFRRWWRFEQQDQMMKPDPLLFSSRPDSKEAAMLFHVSWEFIDTTEEGQKRSLAVFSQWQPPEGADFSRGFYGFTDGSGGVAIVEVDSAATLARTIDPWTPWLRFKATPILPIEESSQLAGEAVAFRDSVG